MQRVKTGIPGLDEIINGGIPEGQTVLVSGSAGAGKTILASNYIYNGAKKFSDPCIYLSFEEAPESIRRNALAFGWDFAPLEKDEKISFVKYDPYHVVDDVVNNLGGEIREIGAKRVVVDSISALSCYIKEEAELRRLVFNLSQVLEKLECTALLLSEIIPGSRKLSRYGVAEFVSDGVIVLYHNRRDSSFTREMQVWKMRGTRHSEKYHPFSITNSGISVDPR